MEQVIRYGNSVLDSLKEMRSLAGATSHIGSVVVCVQGAVDQPLRVLKILRTVAATIHSVWPTAEFVSSGPTTAGIRSC